jgi:hypothetical protein
MRLLKTVYFIFLFSFFALLWWRLVPRSAILWLFLSALAVVISLHVLSHRLYGKMITLDKKSDNIILISGMLVLAIIGFTFFKS